MHLGIKVGPDNWRAKLLDSGLDVRHIEIYYNTAYAEDYPPLYAWMRERGVQGRLHASTMLPGGVFPTLATADAAIRGASADLARRTLEVAAGEGLSAVVIHPGSYLVPRLRAGRVEVIAGETSPEEGSRWATEEMLRLIEYGRARGVEPLFENMPGREYAAYGPVDRSTGVDVRFVPYSVLRDLGQAGACLCVDLAHLYTELMVDGSGSRPHGPSAARHNGLYPRVRAAARELAPYTPHLHLSTIAPPWNGTDGHSGFLDADYARGAIPARDQLLPLLEPFARSCEIEQDTSCEMEQDTSCEMEQDTSCEMEQDTSCEMEQDTSCEMEQDTSCEMEQGTPWRTAGDGLDTWLIPEPLGGSEVHAANYRRLHEWLGDLL